MTEFIPWDSQPLNEWSKKHVTGRFVDLDGYSTHYIEKGDGEPVILLHGYFYDSYQWSKNIDVLAQHFKIYAMDLWGFGYSTREPMDYDYQVYADQLLKFMDTLNIQWASLVGQSMGGGTCILFCTQHRERVNKLILVASSGMPNPPTLLTRIACMPKVGEFLFGMKGSRKGILKTNFIRDKRLLTDEYVENVTRFHKIKGTTEALLKILRKQFWDTLFNQIHELGKMDIPILIVWGRQDKSIPVKLAEDMHRILKGSQLEILDPAGHCPNDEQPEKFNQAAIHFLSSS